MYEHAASIFRVIVRRVRVWSVHMGRVMMMVVSQKHRKGRGKPKGMLNTVR
jgi:hypothetical protein